MKVYSRLESLGVEVLDADPSGTEGGFFLGRLWFNKTDDRLKTIGKTLQTKVVDGKTVPDLDDDGNYQYTDDLQVIEIVHSNHPDVPPHRLIGTDDLEDDAVIARVIANGAVVEGKLAVDSVLTEAIKDGAVTTPKIADGAIIEDKLSSDVQDKINKILTVIMSDATLKGTGTADDLLGLADDAIETKHIKDAQVTNAKMALSSVGTAELQPNAVTTERIGNDEVTEAKLHGDVRTKLNREYHAGEGLALNDDSGTFSIANKGVAPNKLKTPAGDNPADGKFVAVGQDNGSLCFTFADAPSGGGGISTVSTTNPITGDGSSGNPVTITSGKIQNVHLANNAVTTTRVANKAITLAKMADGTPGRILQYNSSRRPVEVSLPSGGGGAGSNPAYAKFSIGDNQAIAGDAGTWTALSPASFAEQHNNGDGIITWVSGSNITLKPGLYNFNVAIPTDGLDSSQDNNARKNVSVRVVDASNTVLSEPTSSTYLRGFLTPEAVARIGGSGAVYVPTETVVTFQTGATYAQQANKPIMSTPGGFLEIYRIATGPKGDKGDKGDSLQGAFNFLLYTHVDHGDPAPTIKPISWSVNDMVGASTSRTETVSGNTQTWWNRFPPDGNMDPDTYDIYETITFINPAEDGFDPTVNVSPTEFSTPRKIDIESVSGGGGVMYTAASGGGLTLTGTAFSVANGGINNARLANNAVNGPKILANSIGTGKFVHGTANTLLGYDSATTPTEIQILGGADISITREGNPARTIRVGFNHEDRLLPSGGDTAQVLTKQSGDDFAFEYSNVPNIYEYKAALYLGSAQGELGTTSNQFGVDTDIDTSETPAYTGKRITLPSLAPRGSHVNIPAGQWTVYVTMSLGNTAITSAFLRVLLDGEADINLDADGVLDDSNNVTFCTNFNLTETKQVLFNVIASRDDREQSAELTGPTGTMYIREGVTSVAGLKALASPLIAARYTLAGANVQMSTTTSALQNLFPGRRLSSSNNPNDEFVGFDDFGCFRLQGGYWTIYFQSEITKENILRGALIAYDPVNGVDIPSITTQLDVSTRNSKRYFSGLVTVFLEEQTDIEIRVLSTGDTAGSSADYTNDFSDATVDFRRGFAKPIPDDSIVEGKLAPAVRAKLNTAGGGDGLPDGGVDEQIIKKTSSTDGAVEWAYPLAIGEVVSLMTPGTSQAVTGGALTPVAFNFANSRDTDEFQGQPNIGSTLNNGLSLLAGYWTVSGDITTYSNADLTSLTVVPSISGTAIKDATVSCVKSANTVSQAGSFIGIWTFTVSFYVPPTTGSATRGVTVGFSLLSTGSSSANALLRNGTNGYFRAHSNIGKPIPDDSIVEAKLAPAVRDKLGGGDGGSDPITIVRFRMNGYDASNDLFRFSPQQEISFNNAGFSKVNFIDSGSDDYFIEFKTTETFDIYIEFPATNPNLSRLSLSDDNLTYSGTLVNKFTPNAKWVFIQRNVPATNPLYFYHSTTDFTDGNGDRTLPDGAGGHIEFIKNWDALIPDQSISARKLHRNAVETDKLKDDSVTPPKLAPIQGWTINNNNNPEPDTTREENFMYVYKKNQNLITTVPQADRPDQWVPAFIGDDNDGDFRLQESIQSGKTPAVQHGRTNYALRIADKAVKRQNIRDPLALENFIGLTMFGGPSGGIGSTHFHRTGFTGWIKYAPNQFPNVQYSSSNINLIFEEHRDTHTRDITHILVRIGRKTGLTSSTSVETFYNLATQSGVSGVDATDGQVYNEIMIPLYVPYHISTTSTGVNLSTITSTYQFHNLLFPNTAPNQNVAIRLSNEVRAGAGRHNFTAFAPVRNITSALTTPNDVWISFHAVRGIGG